MSNIKTYEMPGCISCRIKFALGKAKPFEAFFDGGIPDKNYPAVYVAHSIGQQLAIENSEMFKVGKIRVKGARKQAIRVREDKASINTAPSADTPVVEEAPISVDAKVYPEATTLVDVIAILKGEYKVSATRLKSEASILRVAEEKNVSFPNLKI